MKLLINKPKPFKNKGQTKSRTKAPKKATTPGYKIKKALLIFLTILTVLLVTFATLCIFAEKWMTSTWAALSFEELLYQLSTPLEGTESSMLRGFLFNGLTPALIMLFFSALILFVLRKKSKKVYILSSLGMIFCSVIVFGIAFVSAWIFLDLSNYLSGDSSTDFIEEKYTDPSEVSLTFPSEKRNLIYIFMESMEMTYSDEENGGAFEENCIPELTELAEENECFSGDSNTLNGAVSLPGSTWTMGALFAQTSGLPLKISIGENQMSTQTEFFPTITTLGDILEEAGYKNEYLLGSDATFGGRRLYFTSHGNYDIKDVLYADANGWIPSGYRVFWGCEDFRLMEFAKNELTELAAGDEPFNLTMLTVDTHFEDGYICPYCENTFENNQYANVMACSSSQISSLVRWIQQQDWYEDTTIVICGDHPTMDADFCEDVPSSYQRRVYTTIINADAEKEYDVDGDRLYSTFDMFPTTLAALGVDIDGDRLGLGTNLYSSLDTYTELYGVKGETSQLSRKSAFMTELANLDVPEETTVPAPSADCEITRSSNNKSATITINNVKKNGNVVNNAKVKIWSGDDDSNAKFISLKRDDKQRYSTIVNLSSYYQDGEVLHLEAYLVDASSNYFRVGYDAIDNN